ncbi:toprim domain-containing protein [Marinobacter sp.]|uniref:toprim domain-containing protein n=1 Tax=Marinobacter sp. TaxID=50741 RepID=UPI00356B01C5
MVIVIESPYKAASLKRALRANQIDGKVIATNGRLFDLPSSEIGLTTSFNVQRFEAVDPSHYESIKSDLMAPELVIATDPDEEGDMIAWTIGKLREGLETYRAELFDFTDKSVATAIEKLRPVTTAEPPALSRRIFDRLLGFSGNDGMFLSRSAGALLGFASATSLAITKTVESISCQDADNGMAFCERFNDVQGNGVQFGIEKPGQLPRLRHLYALGPELGATPEETFNALQELYTGDEISYFRTDAMTLNESAHEALENLSNESGFDNWSRRTPLSTQTTHPGIYVTRYVDSPPTRGQRSSRKSVLAQKLHRYICNATLFAMSDPDTRSRVRLIKHDRLYTATTSQSRGQTYSYPDTTFSLSDDILTGSPDLCATHKSFEVKKETSIALALSGMGVGHPSSWASLARSYSCLFDKNGRMSTRGVAFFHKHKSEAPALLEPDIARAIEATLLDPQIDRQSKIQKTLSLAGIDPARFENRLAPEPGPGLEPRFDIRGPGL